MIGGIIDSVYTVADCTAIVVQSTDNPTRYSEIEIKTHPEHRPERGDGIWWQGPHALWTPADRSLLDVKLEKVSYSYPVPYEK